MQLFKFTKRGVQKEINARSEYFDKIAQKYGRDVVPAARVYEIAADVIQPVRMSFTELKPGYYAAQAAPDIIYLLELFPTKGGSYYLRWGVSLAYMPHKWNPKLQWHRTLKSARFDVWENPINYLNLRDQDWRKAGCYCVGRLNGEVYLREQMKVLWEHSAPLIEEWFEATKTLPGVLQAIDWQLERPGKSKTHWPPPRLVRTFTLARMGDVQDARSGLQNYFDESAADSVDRKNLSAGLESVTED